MYVYIYSILHTSGWVHGFKVPYGDFCYKYHRSCFFLRGLYLCELCEGEEVRIIKIRYKF